MQRFFSTIFRWITSAEEICLSWAMIGIAALTITNMAARTLFAQSLAFAEELIQFLMVLVTFVGLGYGVSQGRHIRMTALYDQLPVRFRKALMLFISATTSALMFVLMWLSLDYVLGTVRELGSMSPVLRVPLYLVYLVAPLGFVLAGIQYALAFIKNVMADGVYLSFDHEDTYEEPPVSGV